MAERPSEQSETIRLKSRFKVTSDVTKVFDNWNESIRSFFQSTTPLEDGELPIIAFYQSETHWFLITSRRLRWSNPDQSSYELRHENVRSVGWSGGPEGMTLRDPVDPPDTLITSGDGKGHCKYNSSWLHIVDYSGKRYDAYLQNLTELRNTIWQLSAGWFNASKEAAEQNEQSAKSIPPAGSDAYKVLRLRSDVEKNYAEQLTSTIAHQCKEAGRKVPNDYLQLTLLCENIDDSTIGYFCEEFGALQDSEIPILACCTKFNSGILITSRRMFWNFNNKNSVVRFSDVESFGMSYGPQGALIDWINMNDCLWKDPQGRRLWPSKVANSQSPWLFGELIDGQRFEIYFEPGQRKYMIEHCLRKMMRLEKRHLHRKLEAEGGEMERHPPPVMRLKALIMSSLNKFKSPEPCNAISSAFSEIEEEWLSLWRDLDLRLYFISKARPGTFQQFRINGEAISFTTPAFVSWTDEDIKISVVLLEKMLADFSKVSESLSLLRKLTLWSAIILTPAVLSEISKEYISIVQKALRLFKVWRLRDVSFDLVNFADLIEGCDKIESLVFRKLSDRIQLYKVEKTAEMPNSEVLQDLEQALQNRLYEAGIEIDKASNKIKVAESQLEKENRKCFAPDQIKWEKTRDKILVLISLVKEAIACAE